MDVQLIDEARERSYPQHTLCPPSDLPQGPGGVVCFPEAGGKPEPPTKRAAAPPPVLPLRPAQVQRAVTSTEARCQAPAA